MLKKHSSNVLWRRDVFTFGNWAGFCMSPPVVPSLLHRARDTQSTLIDDWARPSSRQGKDDLPEEDDSLTLSDRLDLAAMLGFGVDD